MTEALRGNREALIGTIAVHNGDGKASKFDEKVLNIDGETLNRWGPVPEIFWICDCSPRTSPRYIRD